MHEYRIRKRLKLVSLTVRTNSFKNQSMPNDFVVGLLCDFLIQVILIRIRCIDYFFALDTKHMIVQVGTPIVAIGARHTHMANLSILTKQVQISIYSSMTDFRILLMHFAVNLVSRRMIVP